MLYHLLHQHEHQSISASSDQYRNISTTEDKSKYFKQKIYYWIYLQMLSYFIIPMIRIYLNNVPGVCNSCNRNETAQSSNAIVHP